MPDRSRCPNCREPVSPFAAGCAVCGTDLDPKRWDTGPSVTNRIGSVTTPMADATLYRLSGVVRRCALVSRGS